MLQSHVTSLHVNLLFPINNKTNTSEKYANSTSSKFRFKKKHKGLILQVKNVQSQHHLNSDPKKHKGLNLFWPKKNINLFYFILIIPKCNFLLKSLKTRKKVNKLSFLNSKLSYTIEFLAKLYCMLDVTTHDHTQPTTWHKLRWWVRFELPPTHPNHANTKS